MASKELKTPQNFNEIQNLINEYNYMQDLIKKAEDGRKILLGFVYTNSCGTAGKNHETLDYTWGRVFADCLKERCKFIENLISKNLSKNI